MLSPLINVIQSSFGANVFSWLREQLSPIDASDIKVKRGKDWIPADQIETVRKTETYRGDTDPNFSNYSPVSEQTSRTYQGDSSGAGPSDVYSTPDAKNLTIMDGTPEEVLERVRNNKVLTGAGGPKTVADIEEWRNQVKAGREIIKNVTNVIDKGLDKAAAATKVLGLGMSGDITGSNVFGYRDAIENNPKNREIFERRGGVRKEEAPPLIDVQKAKVYRDGLVKSHASKTYIKSSLEYPDNLTSGSSAVPFMRYLPVPYVNAATANLAAGNFSAIKWEEILTTEGGGTGGDTNTNNPIYLPMTGTITQNTNPNWTQEEDILSKLTGNTTTSEFAKALKRSDTLGKIGTAGAALGKAASGATQQVLTEAAKIAGGILGGDPLQAGMRRLGLQFNPFQERFFKDVSFRVYTFEHKFMPSNSEESNTILNIIRRFQFYSLPELSGWNAMMFYPATWRIGFFHTVGEKIIRNENLPLLENCVLTLVGVVYGGGGSWAQLANGEPVETTLSLQATEISVPTKNRMAKEVNQLEGDSQQGVYDKSAIQERDSLRVSSVGGN
tara:strand:+ start:31 stop:1701 length:1671 start_codon:yes stop_codon:yes gene_type:complete